ncbi:MAG: sulfur oxidation c-type cytochrome SoxX [SAR86 cluster bacterium]|jgi:sulfur-oxidizing protein SoxX|tara:strand:- start:696 stop:1046 length:351 start_codon:yes stop_codon:yes gene_type:complete
MNNIKKLSSVLLTTCISGWAMAEVSDEQIAAGKAIAFDRNAGNCLSCHMIPEGELPGNVGPPLIQMKLRFPDRSVLRAQVWDAAVRNPNTVMPPYGRHSILTEAEIDRVIDFILTI